MDVATATDLDADGARLAVVAADPVVRRALAALLRARFERSTVEAFASLPDAPGDLAPAADVVLWDLGADDAQVADRFDANAAPDAPVVALLPAPSWSRAALAWGARAALPRDADDVTLAAALRAAAAGLVTLAPSFAEALAVREEADPPPAQAAGDATLTAREREVLQLVAEGFSNKLVAHRLGISEHTVKFHVNAVMARLGAQSRTEAVVRAARRGLLVL